MTLFKIALVKLGQTHYIVLEDKIITIFSFHVREVGVNPTLSRNGIKGVCLLSPTPNFTFY